MSEETATDEHLMQRLGEGEDVALNVLMNRWQGKLVAFLFRLTHDLEVAKDLTQETFIRLYGARSRYRAGGSFSGYLYKIAGNLGRNYLRWKKRHPTDSMELLSNSGLEFKGKERNPRENATSRDEVLLIQGLLDELPEKLRLPLILSVWDGMSYKEIAQGLKDSEKAVEMRIYRAREFLREQLQKRNSERNSNT